jgi:translation initiation factor IF-2
LKHLTEDVREVKQGFECGIAIKGFDAFQVGDVLECFILEKAQASKDVF